MLSSGFNNFMDEVYLEGYSLGFTMGLILRSLNLRFENVPDDLDDALSSIRSLDNLKYLLDVSYSTKSLDEYKEIVDVFVQMDKKNKKTKQDTAKNDKEDEDDDVDEDDEVDDVDEKA